MKHLGTGGYSSGGAVLVLLRLAFALVGGTAAGLAALALTYGQMGWNARTDDVAYAFGSGIGCLVTGVLLLCLRGKGLDWVWLTLVAVLLGTGVTFSTLGVFWWIKRVIFPYGRYREISYLLGEVGGYSGPGLGLLTCGIVLLWSYWVWPDGGRRSPSEGDPYEPLSAVSPPRGRTLGLLLRLALASILGTGGGLLGAALTYVLFGTWGPTSVLAGFLAVGIACLITGIAFLLLCSHTDGPPWLWRIGVALLLLVGIAVCSRGVFEWLAAL